MKAEKTRRILDLSYISTSGEDYDVYHEAKCELSELERLAEIGRATEKAFESHGADMFLDHQYDSNNQTIDYSKYFDSIESLITWHRSTHEGKAGEGK